MKLRYSGKYIIELIPVGQDLFYYEEGFGMQVKFTSAGIRKAEKVTIDFDDGFPGLILERESDKEWLPSSESLKIFEGKYYSKHLDYYWNFELNEQGKLVLKRPTMPDAVMKPDGENQFHYVPEKNPGDGFDQWITFNKTPNGQISELTVWSARVMHHRFVKL